MVLSFTKKHSLHSPLASKSSATPNLLILLRDWASSGDNKGQSSLGENLKFCDFIYLTLIAQSDKKG
ncbi:MAG: hypothetical protein D6797_02075 [Bdellovibrio sp.]|nr:MAG: hypothetical protein D6797_02075 [Bdellovibrio sp.]